MCSQSFVLATMEKRKRLRATGHTSSHVDVSLPRHPPFQCRSFGDRYASSACQRRVLGQKNGFYGLDEEGYSTDATLPPSDAVYYLVALHQLSRNVIKSDEFKGPSLGIGLRFAGWQQRFADRYIGAWSGLGLVGAWEFWCTA
jgi:hypothetical protein